MEFEVVLQYGAVLFSVTSDHADRATAELVWTHGEYACDCARSEPLLAVGALDAPLPCNPGRNQIGLVLLRPMYYH